MIGLTRFWRWHLRIERRHILHLEREVDYWRGLYREERQRAEVAINVCRQSHQGVGGLPVPSVVPQAEMRPADFAADPEWQAIGNPTGVDR